jgi:hypothetical protein
MDRPLWPQWRCYVVPLSEPVSMSLKRVVKRAAPIVLGPARYGRAEPPPGSAAINALSRCGAYRPVTVLLLASVLFAWSFHTIMEDRRLSSRRMLPVDRPNPSPHPLRLNRSYRVAQRAHHVNEIGDVALRRKQRANTGFPLRDNGFPQWRIPHQIERLPDGVVHRSGHKFARHVMVDKMAYAVGIGGEHGTAAAHRFRHGISEPFRFRSGDEHAA